MSQRQNPARFRFSSRVRAAAFALFVLLALTALPAALRAENQYTVMPAGAQVIDAKTSSALQSVNAGQTVRIIPSAPDKPACLQLTPASHSFTTLAVFHWADSNAVPLNLEDKVLPVCEFFAGGQEGATPTWDVFKAQTPLFVFLTTQSGKWRVRCVRKGISNDVEFALTLMQPEGKGVVIKTQREGKNITVFVNEKPIINITDEAGELDFAWGTRAFYPKVEPAGLLAKIDGGSGSDASGVKNPGRSRPEDDKAKSGAGRFLLDVLALLISLLTLAGVVFVFLRSETNRKASEQTIKTHIANVTPPPVNKPSWAEIADLQEKFKDVSGKLAALQLDHVGRLDKIDKDVQILTQSPAQNRNSGTQTPQQQERGGPVVAADPRIDTIEVELKRLRALFYNLDAHIKNLEKERDAMRRANSASSSGSVTSSPAPLPVRNPAPPVTRNQAQTPPPNRNVQPHQAKVYTAPGANWQQDWEQKRRRLEKIALNKESDAPFRVDFEMLESYYKTLVEDWREYRSKPPHQDGDDGDGWKSNWRLNAIDYHLYSEPMLVCDESNAAFYDLEDMKAIVNVIGTAQEKRKEELKEWRLLRIEGTPGVTASRAGELEEEEDSEREPTADPKRDGTFCRITPGLGGYKHNQNILRPTKAIFYRISRREKRFETALFVPGNAGKDRTILRLSRKPPESGARVPSAVFCLIRRAA